MADYPPEVTVMVEALNSIPGVQDVEVGLQAIDDIDLESLTLSGIFALMPHLAIRRSGGGKSNEALITFAFDLSKDQQGWVALEFISWWIRDMCRAEHELQIRPLAFPPSAGDTVQLGKSLSFRLEIFYVEPNDDPMKIAQYVGECGESLSSSVSLYQKELSSAV